MSVWCVTKPEGSFPCPQEPTTTACVEVAKSKSLLTYFCEIHLNVIVPRDLLLVSQLCHLLSSEWQDNLCSIPFFFYTSSSLWDPPHFLFVWWCLNMHRAMVYGAGEVLLHAFIGTVVGRDEWPGKILLFPLNMGLDGPQNRSALLWRQNLRSCLESNLNSCSLLRSTDWANSVF